MKIFHLFFGFRMGGSESMVIDLANRQAADGHNVTLVVLNDDIDPTLLARLDSSVTVSLMRRRQGSRNPWPLLRLNAYILLKRPDILHFHNISLTGAVLSPLRHNSVVTLHTTSLPISQARGAALAAISDRVADEVHETYPAAEVTTIYNAIDFERVERRRHRLLGSRVKLVQLGRIFSEIKGQDLVIRALAILKSRGITNIDVDFIGPGPEIESLTLMAETLGVGENVRFLGMMSRSETYSRLAEYDIMVHPSRIEGFGLAIVEGMAAALPVITTNSGAPAEVVGHGRLGYTFVYEDPESLAEVIADVVENYPAALEMAQRAYDHAAGVYALRAMTDSYLQLYNKLLGNK